MYYLDNAATTPVDPELAKICYETMTELFGNPSSLYTPGMKSEQAINKAREQVAATLGVTAQEIYFTACGTESDSIAILGAAQKNKKWATNIVTTGYEHPAVFKTLDKLAEQGWEIRTIKPSQEGTIDETELLNAVDSKTGLVTFMFVNNEIGSLIDITALARKVKEKTPRTSVHVDGVQGWCKHTAKLTASDVDTFAISGHKMRCPKGIGALYIRKNYIIDAAFVGGGQEKGMRPGTENIPYIVTLGAAAEKYGKTTEKRLAEVTRLNNLLRKELAEIKEVEINSPINGSPYILNFSIEDINSETMLHSLEETQVYVSSGSACSKGAQSHTLIAMDTPPSKINGAIRVSFCDMSTEKDIECLIKGLKEGIKTLLRR